MTPSSASLHQRQHRANHGAVGLPERERGGVVLHAGERNQARVDAGPDQRVDEFRRTLRVGCLEREPSLSFAACRTWLNRSKRRASGKEGAITRTNNHVLMTPSFLRQRGFRVDEISKPATS
jgi:hypothetical protein